MNTQTKYTSDFVPIKAITNGTIVLETNEKVTGVKIEPRNIFISDVSTQQSVINNLQNVYNLIDYEFWLIVADRPVDIKVYLSQLQILYNQTQNPVKRKIIMADLEKANSFTHDNIVDTEFYLLFKEKDIEQAQKKVRNLVNSFASAGLVASPVSNEDLRIILDNFLNGGQTTSFGTVMS